MSNYVYEEKALVPFNIRDMGYAVSSIKQGIPGAIQSDPSIDPYATGLLIPIDKTVWNDYKNNLSGSDFSVTVKTTNNLSVFSNLTFSSITCVFGEEYENIDYVTLYGTFYNVTLSPIPTQRTKIELMYLPNNKTFTKDNIACRTAGGRVMGRHVNWEGSVINFDQYGTRTNLYIPDVKFRNSSSKSISSSYDSRYIQIHTPSLHLSASTRYLLNYSPKKSSEPFTDDEFFTDKQLQTKLDSYLNNGTFADDFTAKQGTDAILSSLDAASEAALLARSLVPTNLRACDLPNIYELTVIWLESDNIDTIDPTIDPNANEYSNKVLGSPSRFISRSHWTCTENYADSLSCSSHLESDGNVDYDYRTKTKCVLPVLEL